MTHFKQPRVPSIFLREQFRARYRMPEKDELMPLAKSPLEFNGWVNALFALGPIALAVIGLGVLFHG